jgi:hypothetical protein
MKQIKLTIFFLFVITFTSFAQQQGDYSKEPGYYDFGNLLSLKSGDTLTEVYLEEPLLKMVAQMGESKDEELGKMINGLKLVKVNEFMVDKKEFKKLDGAFDSVNGDLLSNKWNRIIKTKHGETTANVYVKSGTDKNFTGLFITAVDKKGKVTLVNIVGTINPLALGKLSQQFHFPNIEKMKEKKKEESL